MNRIRQARQAIGITMRQLGKKVGCSEAAISNYELGKREPDYETLLKIGEVLGVSVSYLLGEGHDKKTLTISPEKQKLLKAVEGMSNDELVRLLKIIEAMKE